MKGQQLPTVSALDSDAAAAVATEVLREVCTTSVVMALANKVAQHWPVNKSTKSSRAMHTEGLLIGLQPIWTRWQFQQYERHFNTIDPLFPSVPPHASADYNSVQEFVDAGFSSSVAAECVLAMQEASATAARTMSLSRAALALLPIGGEITIGDVDGAHREICWHMTAEREVEIPDGLTLPHHTTELYATNVEVRTSLLRRLWRQESSR